MIVVLLPAYNEERALPELLPKLRDVLDSGGQRWRVVVGNDGSCDGTAALLQAYREDYPLDVIEHPINRGLGETVRDLYEYAVRITEPDDVIVRMDCDDTHEPAVIERMIAKIAQGCDVVIASRFQSGGGQLGVSPYRAFVSRGANLFMKLFFPMRGVREYSCGFRAYRSSILKRAIAEYGNDFIQLKGLGFTCTLEKLVKLNLLGARFGEVPFVLRYDQKRSASKMIGSVTTLGYVVMLVLYYWPWGGWRRSYRARFQRAAQSEAN